MNSPTPVKPQSRLEFVDILRGFALFGVLAANMSSFSGYLTEAASYADFLDGAVLVGIQFFIRAKFYSLFSFLFGWGMSIQMIRAAEKGHRFLPVFVRRMAILLAFGLVHGLLIWHGDILTLYALLGFLLLLFRKRSTRTLLIAVPLLLLLTIVLNLPVPLMNDFRAWYAEITAFMRQGNLPNSVYGDGGFFLVLQKNMQDYWAAQSWILFYIGGVFSMFLLGLYVGKRRIFQDVEAHLPLLRRTMILGLIVGAIFNGLFVWNTLHPEWVATEYTRFAGIATRTIGAPAMMLFYVSGITLLTRKTRWLQRLRPLGFAGRMALSNYLMQSLVCVLIFYGYGLGLYGKTDPTFGMILTILLFAAQIRLSRRHLQKHSFGPMEWLWRTLTYGRRQPWKKQEFAEDTFALRAANLWRRSPRSLKVGLIVITLAIMAGSFFIWNRQTGAIKEITAPVVVRYTPAAAVQLSESTAASAETLEVPESIKLPIATPQVEPVAFVPGSLIRDGDMRALAQAFDANEALEQIDILSNAPFDGRRAGSIGGLAAGDYIADQFAALDLQPAGIDGTFFQSFPISYTNLSQAPQFHLILEDGATGIAFEPFKDFSPLISDYVGAGQINGDVVWMNHCTHGDFAQLEVVEKVVLCQVKSDYLQAHREAVEHGAGGLLLITDPAARPPDMGDRFTESWIPEPIPALRVYPALVDALFAGSGTTITETLLLEQPQALTAQVDFDVSTLGDHACPVVNSSVGCTGRNILGVLPGRDPDFAHEIVILGAHYDHLGAAPSGGDRQIVWSGANDNASGTAVLLEIARVWQEQGYVPRRTVLFAAWDAEELGLLGSTYYVENPQYPPADVVAKINLDMVGSGENLFVDGSADLLSTIATAAESLDYMLQETQLGRSDHVPFLEHGTPAAMFIWLDENGQLPDHYHRPADTSAVIDKNNLKTAGELAALTALNLVEIEPSILAMLDQRAEAVVAGDQDAFLQTSHPDERAVDALWFADLTASQPLSMTITSDNLQISGDLATAETAIAAAYLDAETGNLNSVTGQLQAQFQRSGNDWLWAGPDMRLVTGEGVSVSYSPNIDDDLSDLPAAIRGQYDAVASALGLPTGQPMAMQLFDSAGALRSSTGLFLPDDTQNWVAPGLIKLVYTKGISETAATCRTGAANCPTDSLVHLALANSGLATEDKIWLWLGLPQAWQAETDPIRVQTDHIPLLHAALVDDTPIPPQTAAWAATDYAIQQVGWGNLLTWPESEDWRPFWENRLAEAQKGLDALLEQRTEAVLDGNEAIFLNTAVPELASAQQRWLADLDTNPVTSFSQTAEPIAFLDDGSVIARVTMNYEIDGRGPSTAAVTIRFVPVEGRLLWAGKYLHEIESGDFIVRYPHGYEHKAAAVQMKLSTWMPELAGMLDISPTLPIEVELYDAPDDMRAAIALPYYATNWTEPGQPIKVQANAGDGVLITQLTRQLLGQAGVEEEWLLRGIAANIANRFDGGATLSLLAGNWRLLQAVAADSSLLDLKDVHAGPEMSQGENLLADLQAWDAVRYYIATRGWDTLLSETRSVDILAGDDFQRDWRESLVQAHLNPEWLEISSAYDPQQVLETIEFLSSAELAGRQAGSDSAEMAAAAIAEAYEEAGLIPAGDSGTFFQTVPITISETIDVPQFSITGPDGEEVSLVFREEFLPVRPSTDEDPVTGDLYYVQKTADYGSFDFDGAIIIREPALATAAEIRLAEEHNAGALILTSFKHDEEDIFGKQPGSSADPGSFPVLELTSDGVIRLLEAFEIKSNQTKNLLPLQPLEGTGMIRYTAAEPHEATTSNVLGFLLGSNPFLADEVIIVGAHYDYVGDDEDGRRYSGANDASGVATLLEIVKLWEQEGYRPQRSVLFTAWGAQEMGNLGSQYYIAQPTLPLSDTIAMVQIEGVGGGGGFDLGAQGDEMDDGWLLGTLETAVGTLGDKLVITPETTVSDLSSFNGQNFPSILISWRLAGDANLPDNIAYPVNTENLQLSGQAAALLLMSLAQ